MKRRTFIRCLGCGAALAATPSSDLIPEFLGGLQNALAFDYARELSSVEARYYKKVAGGGIECLLCPRHCFITDLERGYCGVRENRNDIYYTLVYGLPCSVNIDPIEKKPLFHFYPGSEAFSLATAGCNVNCKFCQNWEISQTRPEQTNNIDLPPQGVIDICREQKVPNIAYTYSEPIVFYEYMYDIAVLGHKNGIRSVMITGGYIEKDPMNELLKHLDAVKVDLKAIREEYYKSIVNGELKPVLDTLVRIKKAGVWLEIVYLVVPTLNDTDAEFVELAQWIKTNLGVDTPVHFSRFYPQYLLKNLPPTPQTTLERAYQISRAEGLQYVYLGNIPGHPAESTYCPGCGEILIQRQGYRLGQYNLIGSRCKKCNREIPGLF
ncbi:MAG: AmmeMemoRadiSam system radical SAM enzyme [candidate division Zixibacteria bacterium]|nr:AmmeMemoRadiSam system radical SAM enzyme [candidate division Zixibacteria bacterium]MDD5424941.1 AmmeMemoRadiSam system radical SAM enzyme [candidate division Zixibacteria bacterium]